MILFVVNPNNTLGKTVREAESYNVTILYASECKKTKETQNDMAVFNYKVMDGKYKCGKNLNDNIFWANNNIELSVKRFNTILAGVGISDGTRIESIQQIVNRLKGTILDIRGIGNIANITHVGIYLLKRISDLIKKEVSLMT